MPFNEKAVFGSPLPCQLSDGTTCPPLLCPNTSIILTCTLPPMATLLGYFVWKLPDGTCVSDPSSALQKDTISLMQDGLTNCANTMSASCGGYKGQIGFTCRTSTLSVTVTPETNGSEIKCYSASHTNNIDGLEPLGSARVQMMPSSESFYVCANYDFKCRSCSSSNHIT